MMNNHYDELLSPPIVKIRDVTAKHVRGWEHNIRKVKGTKSCRKYFFKNRVVNFWNELPTKVKTAPSLPSFERRLDKYWSKFNIKFNYDRCISFERERFDPNFAGTGTRNAKLNRMDDLELQAL